MVETIPFLCQKFHRSKANLQCDKTCRDIDADG